MKRLPAQAAGVTLAPDQLLDVFGVLDAGRLVEAARMAGDDLHAVEDAHLFQRRGHGEGTPHMGMRDAVRDAVLIFVEAGVGGLGDPDLAPLVDGEAVVGQRHQGAALALEGLAHGEGAVVRPGAVGGDALAPLPGLGVEIVEVTPGAGGEEAVAHIAYGALDAPFFVASGDRDRLRQEAVGACEVEKPGIEADGVAAPLQHDALQIVVPELGEHALPGLEGLDMAAQEVVRPGVEVEAQKEAARVAEHHHEGHQRALRTPDPHLAEVDPVDLGLLAGQSLEAQTGLGHRARPLQFREQ